VAVTPQEAAQRVRAGAAYARSVLFTGPAATYLDATRSLVAAGVTPRVYLSYLTESSDAAALREGAAVATWPGSRHLAAISTAPTSAARATFLQSYTDRSGAPSTIAATAYDALALLETAAESIGGAPDRTRLRDRLEAATFAGIATRYAFGPTRHAGFDLADLAYLRWASVGGRSGFALAPDPAPKEDR
jgi:hypothetical protein